MRIGAVLSAGPYTEELAPLSVYMLGEAWKPANKSCVYSPLENIRYTESAAGEPL